MARVSDHTNDKKGDLSLATNYRGISLMAISAKIYNKLLLNRLIPFVGPILRKNQNGFSVPHVSSLVKYRRVQFAGHCFRADAEVISSLLLWRPSYGKIRRRKLSFPDVISRDTGLSTEDLRTAMRDRNVWSDIVQSMVATAVD